MTRQSWAKGPIPLYGKRDGCLWTRLYLQDGAGEDGWPAWIGRLIQFLIKMVSQGNPLPNAATNGSQ